MHAVTARDGPTLYRTVTIWWYSLTNDSNIAKFFGVSHAESDQRSAQRLKTRFDQVYSKSFAFSKIFKETELTRRSDDVPQRSDDDVVDAAYRTLREDITW